MSDGTIEFADEAQPTRRIGDREYMARERHRGTRVASSRLRRPNSDATRRRCSKFARARSCNCLLRMNSACAWLARSTRLNQLEVEATADLAAPGLYRVFGSPSPATDQPVARTQLFSLPRARACIATSILSVSARWS